MINKLAEFRDKNMAKEFITRRNPAIFEINTASWLYELSLKQGITVHLGDVPPGEWDALKALGMDYVWLIGVWKRSQPSRFICLNSPEFRYLFDDLLPGWTDEDVIGSAYSVSALEPSELIGTWKDIDRARSELHKRGLGLVLDFIPNHTGFDHPWVREHPEYYVQGDKEDYLKDPAAFFVINFQGRTLYIAHGRDPNFPPWSDTAQINYLNPAARLSMIECLETTARHCDGVRCDMAMLVLNGIFRQTWGRFDRNSLSGIPQREFWEEAVDRVPWPVYIAEAYWDTEWTLQQLGFDFAYDKRLYDRLLHAGHQEVYLHLTAEIGYQQKLLRFVENHDEPRSLTTFGRDKVRAAAALASTLPGMRLYFQGQMEGRKLHLPLQLRQAKPEADEPEIKAFYERLMPLVNEDVFHSGRWQLKKVYPETAGAEVPLIAYTWTLGEKLMLVIINLSPQPASGRVHFQDDVFEDQEYTLKDRFNLAELRKSGKLMAHPGLVFKLDGYQVQIFEITT
jgi:hypothetical protein